MRILLLFVCTVAFAIAADPYASLQFTDGKSRSAADFAGQGVVTVYFCGH